MKILIACEFSGIVREAFRKKGHDAWSCDLLPSEIPGQHIQDDVLNHLNDGWDLMIAHPPCTYLTTAGNGWFNIEKYGEKAIKRIEKQKEAIKFVNELNNAPINKICIENPQGRLNTLFKKPTQTIYPYEYGDEDSKRTCLWLKNLPPLVPRYNKRDCTLLMNPPKQPKIYGYYNKGKKKGKPKYFCDDAIKYKENRWAIRSKTFKSIADAMADQWG